MGKNEKRNEECIRGEKKKEEEGKEKDGGMRNVKLRRKS